jgi:hypothetical protein
MVYVRRREGRSDFDARSVLSVREHDKMARTPLVDFFNIPSMWRRACLLQAHILLAMLPGRDEECLRLLKDGRCGREKEEGNT